MSKLNYFTKAVISAIALVLLVGCGKKVEPVQPTSSSGNITVENKSSSKISNTEETPKLVTKVTATIEKVNESGKERYILIEYK